MSRSRRLSTAFCRLFACALLAASAAAAQDAAPPTVDAATPASPKVKLGEAVLATVDVVVTNKRLVALTELFAAVSGSSASAKIVGALAPGGKYVARLAYRRDCLFDLRGDYEDGSSTDAVGVALCRDKRIDLVDPVAADNVVDGGIRRQDNLCDWWELDWDEMTNAEQQAWGALGWRSDNWGTDDPKAEPASSSKDWDELNAAEMQAARSLGFEPKTWNPDPDPCEGK